MDNCESERIIENRTSYHSGFYSRCQRYTKAWKSMCQTVRTFLNWWKTSHVLTTPYCYVLMRKVCLPTFHINSTDVLPAELLKKFILRSNYSFFEKQYYLQSQGTSIELPFTPNCHFVHVGRQTDIYSTATLFFKSYSDDISVEHFRKQIFFISW